LEILGLLVAEGVFVFEPAGGALIDKSEPKKNRAGGSQHRPPGQGSV